MCPLHVRHMDDNHEANVPVMLLNGNDKRREVGRDDAREMDRALHESCNLRSHAWSQTWASPTAMTSANSLLHMHSLGLCAAIQ